MDFVTLARMPLPAIVGAFNDAFSEYEVPINMTVERLSSMIAARSVRLDHSFAFAEGDSVVAFVLNGSRIVDGELVAYDSGTGVRRSRQGRGLGTELFDRAADALRALDYRRYLLEVLTGNGTAIALYTGKGLAAVRTLHCYVADRTVLARHYEGVTIGRPSADEMARFIPLLGHRPSWQNTVEAAVSTVEECLVIHYGVGPSAYAVFVPSTGNVMQVGWEGRDIESARRVVATAATLSTASEIKALNIDEADRKTNDGIVRLGFRRYVSQYEMEMRL